MKKNLINIENQLDKENDPENVINKENELDYNNINNNNNNHKDLKDLKDKNKNINNTLENNNNKSGITENYNYKNRKTRTTNKERTERNFSKYKSYSSKNSMIKADSELQPNQIYSNNFFKSNPQEYLMGMKSKNESPNNQSSNLLTTSQMNMLTHLNNQMNFYPLEYFENNKFALINSYGYKTEPGINFNNTPKINQDCFLIYKNIYGYQNFYMLSVLDGHG